MSVEEGVESPPDNQSKVNLKKLDVERIVWVIVVFFTVSIPFLMTVIALVHIEDCPHQPFMPIWLLMSGISMSLSNIINTADKYSPPKQSNYKTRKRIVGSLNLLTNCFTIACFLTGGIWVLGKGKPSYHKSNHDYCNETLYKFALIILNLAFVLIALLLVLIFVGFIIKIVKNSN